MLDKMYLNGLPIEKGDSKSARKTAGRLQKEGMIPKIYGFGALTKRHLNEKIERSITLAGWEFVLITETWFEFGGAEKSGYIMRYQPKPD